MYIFKMAAGGHIGFKTVRSKKLLWPLWYMKVYTIPKLCANFGDLFKIWTIVTAISRTICVWGKHLIHIFMSSVQKYCTTWHSQNICLNVSSLCWHYLQSDEFFYSSQVQKSVCWQGPINQPVLKPVVSSSFLTNLKYSFPI